MDRTTLTLIIFALSLYVGIPVARGDHDSPDGRPQAPTMEQQTAKVFQQKCMHCHESDGKFDENGFPTAEWKQSILDAVHHKTGIKSMPPPSRPPLTDTELKLIDNWAGTGAPADPPGKGPAGACSAADSIINPEVVKGIFADRCVACHGKLSLNPTSLLRKSHTQFLNNDGTVDFSVLGDVSEVPAYRLPQNKTSIGRLLESLTNYTMPPRQNLPVISRPSDSLFPQLGTPHMTDGERQFVISWLNQQLKGQNCPLKEWNSIIYTQSRQSVTSKYAEAYKSCQTLGMRIPTRAQMQAILDSAGNLFERHGCVWTSTFDDDPADSRVRRKILYWEENGTPGFGWGVETTDCQILCAR